jgi:hypothetical protein
VLAAVLAIIIAPIVAPAAGVWLLCSSVLGWSETLCNAAAVVAAACIIAFWILLDKIHSRRVERFRAEYSWAIDE